MFKYIVKRLLLFIPTLIIISIVSFSLMKLAPGDPVLSYMELDGEEVVLNINSDIFRNQYNKNLKALHLDKSLFYCAIKPNNYPNLLHHFSDVDLQQLYTDYLDQGLAAAETYKYIEGLRILKQTIASSNNKLLNQKLNTVITNTSISTAVAHIEELVLILPQSDREEINELGLVNIAKNFLTTRSRYRYPVFKWNGMDNQYHYWIQSLIGITPLRSYIDGQSVITKIAKSIKWTMWMIIPAILISFLLSILMGVYHASYPDSIIAKLINAFNYFVFSIPTFWLATLLLIFFGGILSYLGIGTLIKQEDTIWLHISKMILPIVVIVIHNMAYISRQMYHSMIKQSKEDYLKTAKSKGVSNQTLIWKHQFTNALLPMITMMTAAFPAALSGSVVLELIYNIPGMGRLMYQSLMQMDWPVVFGVLLLLSAVSLVFMLIGDLLYAYINPKIRYDGR